MGGEIRGYRGWGIYESVNGFTAINGDNFLSADTMDEITVQINAMPGWRLTKKRFVTWLTDIGAEVLLVVLWLAGPVFWIAAGVHKAGRLLRPARNRPVVPRRALPVEINPPVLPVSLKLAEESVRQQRPRARVGTSSADTKKGARSAMPRTPIDVE